MRAFGQTFTMENVRLLIYLYIIIYHAMFTYVDFYTSSDFLNVYTKYVIDIVMHFS